MEKLIEAVGITKRFGDFVALNNIHFFLSNGERKGIIGPNGAGKTTLINVLTGFYVPEGGKVFYQGMDITKFPPDKRVKLGLVRTFQISNVFGDLTVLEHLALAYMSFKKQSFIRRYFGSILTKDILQESFKLLRDEGLERYANVKISQLPHGDRRKIEFLMAKLLNPKVLFLDEPFAGLNDKEIEILKSDIIRYIKEQNCSLVIIDHKVSKIIDMIDTLCVLNEGHMICEGKPEEVICDSKVQKIYWKKEI